MFALDVFAISTFTPKLLLMSSARNGVTLYVFALTPVSENVGSVAVAAGLADDVGAVDEPLAGVDACAFAVGVAPFYAATVVKTALAIALLAAADRSLGRLPA